MISAVLINYNEAKLLRRCLESIKDFVSEIVVVDLGSTDESQQVFKEFDVKVFTHSWVPYADPIRNFAISKAREDWVLMLDPDERLSEDLIKRLKTFISSDESKKFTAVNIPFKNIFFGKWISHTNFWPDKHVRFFKKGYLVWEDQVHKYPKVDGLILELPADEKVSVIHDSYQAWGEFISKQKKYALSEARNRRKEGETFSLFRLVWLPLREFLARFIKHKGYLDGINGAFLVIILMWYHILVEWYLVQGVNNEASK
jgi:glycosyltransferase involved in cell wall biosynthesis